MDKVKKTPPWIKWLPVLGALAGSGVAWLQKKQSTTDYLMYAGIGGFMAFTPQIFIVLSNKEISNENSSLSDKERMKKEILKSAKELEPNMKPAEEQAYMNVLNAMTEDELKIGYLTMKMQQDEKRLTKTYPNVFAGTTVNLLSDPKAATMKLKQFAAIAQKEYGIELTTNPAKFNEDIKGYFKKLMGGSAMQMIGGPAPTSNQIQNNKTTV